MRSLVDQIKTSSEGLSNMTQQFIANLSDTMLIYLNYYPSLHKLPISISKLRKSNMRELFILVSTVKFNIIKK